MHCAIVDTNAIDSLGAVLGIRFADGCRPRPPPLMTHPDPAPVLARPGFCAQRVSGGQPEGQDRLLDKVRPRGSAAGV